ncbi:MAG: TetR/AcrR family transcriptional regulator [Flammeovirgaceae bacterium]|nr:TetR/AcrR family transcriptional regulator [Flammeovirgaceae bacterium]
MKTKDSNTENVILKAARKVFTQKGYSGARMDDIANEAGINRALLHYYFRNKDRMFEVIFEQRILEFFSGLIAILSADINLRDKVLAIIDHDMSMLKKHPDLPLFVLQEINQNPDRIKKFILKNGVSPKLIFETFNSQVKKEQKKESLETLKACNCSSTSCRCVFIRSLRGL